MSAEASFSTDTPDSNIYLRSILIGSSQANKQRTPREGASFVGRTGFCERLLEWGRWKHARSLSTDGIKG